MTDEAKLFGKLLKEFRLKASMSQMELSQRSLVPHSLISTLERGQRSAGQRTATKLAKALAMPVKIQEQFLTLARSTLKKNQIDVREERTKEMPTPWLNFVGSIAPGEDIVKITTQSKGNYHLVLTDGKSQLKGVIFKPGIIVVAWTTDLDGALLDVQQFRHLVDKVRCDLSTAELRTLQQKFRDLGFGIRVFRDALVVE